MPRPEGGGKVLPAAPYRAARYLGCVLYSAHKKRATPKHGVTHLRNTTTQYLVVPQWDVAQGLRKIVSREPILM